MISVVNGKSNTCYKWVCFFWNANEVEALWNGYSISHERGFTISLYRVIFCSVCVMHAVFVIMHDHLSGKNLCTDKPQLEFVRKELAKNGGKCTSTVWPCLVLGSSLDDERYYQPESAAHQDRESDHGLGEWVLAAQDECPDEEEDDCSKYSRENWWNDPGEEDRDHACAW